MSVKRVRRTRVIVASSGIAAALLMAAPVGAAAADELTGTEPASPSADGDGAVSDPSTTDTSTTAPSTTAPSTTAPPGTGESGAGDSGSGEPTETTAPPAGESDGATTKPADRDESAPSEESTGTTQPPSESSPPETSGPAETPDPATETPSTEVDDPTTPREVPTWSWPSGRHRADDEPTGRHRADEPATGRHRAATDDAPTEDAVGDGAEGDEAARVIGEVIGEPGTAAAVSAGVDTELPEQQTPRPGAFYGFAGDVGAGGLIFLNQSLAAGGAFLRRSRGDGGDLLGLLNPGDRVTVPAASVVGPLVDSADANPAVDDTDDSLIAQAFDVLTARLQWWMIDPDNRFYDPSDFQVLIGDNYRIADADDITYTYDADADTITFTNTGDTDVAVIAVDQYNVPHGDGLYLVPAGESTTIDAGGDISGYVVQGERDAEGRAIIYGMVVVQDDSTLSQNFNPFGGAIRDADQPIVDPDNKFWDPSEGLATGILWPLDAVGADGAADGVYYSTDASGVTIHNDSDGDIAIIVFSGTADRNLVPQTNFYVVPAGGAHTIELDEGGYALTSVQGERVVGGRDDGKPRLYGSFVALNSGDDTVVTEIDNLPQDELPPLTRV
ncbi:MAG: hypothetical protein CME34_06335 [Gordonia sp.]|uniref:hypothetical protein n=1 Tax=Gordonia sp. (in: high G+C Gram-positive bacteria) TaxID=84139 RepID=UPI000C6A672F|nr:hypothetical protein [Gordonia sp. (in: high G+C Gram-positive bacteria)]MAU81480.1 hypothetical protein [Gordonia sp. (in: high G+C Gram-positive bacteria)]